VEAIIFLQRIKKAKPNKEQELLELIAARKELENDVLHVEEDTKCAICKQGIYEAIERHVCAICEKIVHKNCLGEHLEECVDYRVTFTRKKR
jgi:hypothetical protein